MPAVINHLLQAFRRLTQRAGFTIAAVLTLALGIGANTAAFSMVDRLFLRAFPFREPDRIVAVYEWDSTRSGNHAKFHPSAPNLLDIRQASILFESMAAVGSMTANLTGNGRPAQVDWGTPSPASSYGVTPADPAAFILAAASLAFVALLSTLLPARRAVTPCRKTSKPAVTIHARPLEFS